MFYVFDRYAGTSEKYNTINDLKTCIEGYMIDCNNDVDLINDKIVVIEGEKKDIKCSVNIKVDDIEI